jgi:pimeloyl-ACP methyl ester carboxylesterase
MDFISKCQGGYEDIWKAIIRPAREEYEDKHLGPKEFHIKGKLYRRTDLELKNKKGLVLRCSHFEPVQRVCEQLPCVIYLHGNCSSRLESLYTLEILLPANITLFCFDFAGSGMSEGDFISLGWFEREDIEVTVNHLRSSGRTSTIGLWGRSMGAVASLMYVDRDPCIAGMVVDSPYSNLRVLQDELVRNHTKVPSVVLSIVSALTRKTIKSKAGFDIDNLVPLNYMASSFVPSFFVAGKDDKFVNPKHAQELYDKYTGDKNIVLVNGDHNSARPQFLLDSIAIFFYNTLMVDQLPQQGKFDLDASVRWKIDESRKEVRKNVESEMDFSMLRSKKIGNDFDIQKVLGDASEEELNQSLLKSIQIRESQKKSKKLVKDQPILDPTETMILRKPSESDEEENNHQVIPEAYEEEDDEWGSKIIKKGEGSLVKSSTKTKFNEEGFEIVDEI